MAEKVKRVGGHCQAKVEMSYFDGSYNVRMRTRLFDYFCPKRKKKIGMILPSVIWVVGSVENVERFPQPFA